MDEHALRELIRDVKAGRLSRRRFVQTMVGLGLTAPLAAQMLAANGMAEAQSKPMEFTPTRRGGGGLLKTLWWQAPTLLNPHFATGTKDQDASRIFYEPLAAFDPDGNVTPVLAAEVPNVSNGTLAKDLTWVIWRLKRGVQWHDGKPFTAEDVVFNWEYVADPATAALTVGSYREVTRIETVDTHTVKVVFAKPQPFWSDAFCGNRGMIVPKHVFDGYRGSKSREAPGNLKPVGTGPFRFLDFKPGDVVRAEINPNYHVPNRPFFDQLEMKGGGEAVSAARAVLQTAEYDYAWNMQVEDDILRRLEQGGKGRVNIYPTGSVEHIQCNQSDPWTEVDGERSSAKTTHPLLSDPAVRQALNLLVDRSAVHEQIYGRQGQTSPNFLNAPSRFYSKTTRWEFNVDKANQILDAAGWKRGADGIRGKDGKRLKMLYQTSINAPRQKTQQIVKQAAAKAGMDLELKSVVASVFFSSDAANPDTYGHFYSDLQMYTNGLNAPDPQYFMNQFTSWEVASKANKWQGRNVTRWRNEEYDRAYHAADVELDPVKRAALFIKMNDLVIQNVVAIPVLWRSGVSTSTARLRGMDLTGWDSNYWHLAYWYKQA
ncbi:MAG TPA: peptide ABC transporter substrate-binding protein [Methylomirabilota bacterium]|jgi:peptide/nickel transport system substrate-binding protein|nr:peptide ABC transporter substrate-binding protein [Methylomirabilota bacterium]